MKLVKSICLGALVFLALFSCAHEQKEDCLSQTVCDQAEILETSQINSIDKFNELLLLEHDIEYKVLTLSKVGDINLATNKYFRDMQVGKGSKSGRGLLLVIDSDQNQVRLEVSTSLEGIYTDAFVSYIQHRQMIPFFSASRVADGIAATTEMIVTRAQDATKGQEFIPPTTSKSMGAGVSNDAKIGEGEDLSFKNKAPIKFDLNGASPIEVIKAYHQSLKDRNANPNLSIYSSQTKAMMSKWVVTPAQMDNQSKALTQCFKSNPPDTKIDPSNSLAVVRFHYDYKECSPFFFVRENNTWVLDLTAMTKVIGFNNRNQWHFRMNELHPYGFGFYDWVIDENGFPFEQNRTKNPYKKFRWGVIASICKNGLACVFSTELGRLPTAEGLRDWDMLISLNGEKIMSMNHWSQLLDSTPPNEKIKLLIRREDKEILLTLTAPPK